MGKWAFLKERKKYGSEPVSSVIRRIDWLIGQEFCDD